MHELRTPFRDGTTHLVFEPLELLERLAALVPPPRVHQLTYHGVLAPAASWRDAIVPRRARDRRASCGGWCSRHSWPELMRRVFAVDVLKCAKCGSRRRWIAAITERDVIVHILEHLGLPSELPVPAPARAPPRGELDFRGERDCGRTRRCGWGEVRGGRPRSGSRGARRTAPRRDAALHAPRTGSHA